MFGDKALNILGGDNQHVAEAAQLAGQVVQPRTKVGAELVHGDGEGKLALVLFDNQDVTDGPFQLAAEVSGDGHADGGDVQLTDVGRLALRQLQCRDKRGEDTVVVQHVINVDVAGIAGKDVAVDVVEHGQHAVELLDKVAVLVQHALVPF
ncbi:hypothetical protein D3C80_1224750 [compost metagenome]